MSANLDIYKLEDKARLEGQPLKFYFEPGAYKAGEVVFHKEFGVSRMGFLNSVTLRFYTCTRELADLMRRNARHGSVHEVGVAK
jgi:hypothetical protein